MSVTAIRSNIKRRIIVRTIVFAIWVAGLAALALSGHDLETDSSTYLCAAFALAAVWAVQLVRDLRCLRSDGYLAEAAIAQNDERNILIAYKATRLAAVVCITIAPIAMAVLGVLGMVEAFNALAGALCVFAVTYVVCYGIINARN